MGKLLRRCLSLVWGLLLLSTLYPGFATKRAVSAEGSEGALWREIGEGISYREFYLAYPEHLYVARLDRDQPNATLESSIAQGRLSGGLETVRDMANRYDQAINFWGERWGGRSQVVVAINGYFFDTETGVPRSGQVQSGWYAKRFDERQSGSGFAWTLDRNAFVGGCVVHKRDKQVVHFLDSNERMAFDGTNISRDSDELIVYTSHFDTSTLTEAGGVEVLVELNEPMIIIPEPAMVTGTIQLVRDDPGNMPIPFDHIVLSASGEKAARLRTLAREGDQIGISQELHHFAPDCNTPNPLDWTRTYASVGGSFVFLRQGAIQKFDDLGAVLRSPRTAIAYNERYIYYIVVDGRDHLRSLGMSMVELAVFARNYLGAVWGVALDGGGSSTMVVNGVLMNNPLTEVQDSSRQNRRSERFVANGMLMVVVLPRENSNRYKPGEAVRISASPESALRLGPGDNYARLGNLTLGSQGVILDHPGVLNGVLAKGAFWWKVDFQGAVGWVREEDLAAAP